MIIDFIGIKFLHVFHLLTKRINFMTLKHHSRFHPTPISFDDFLDSFVNFSGFRNLIWLWRLSLLIRLFLSPVFFLFYLILLNFNFRLFSFEDFNEIRNALYWLRFSSDLGFISKRICIISSRKCFQKF